MNRSLARGIGIGLVLALSGLFVVGFAFFARLSGSGTMSPQFRFNDVCVPPSLSGQTIYVSVFDMGMMMGNFRRMGLSANPSTIASGRVNIFVANMGMRKHEVVILPLASGVSAGARAIGSDGKVDESGSFGEVSNNCASGRGEGILAGSRGWTTLNLAPGRYEFLCNLRNHYSAGMYQEVVVTG
jgi:uncharacterized cupredoxin-like copper-binding protein